MSVVICPEIWNQPICYSPVCFMLENENAIRARDHDVQFLAQFLILQRWFNGEWKTFIAHLVSVDLIL